MNVAIAWSDARSSAGSYFVSFSAIVFAPFLCQTLRRLYVFVLRALVAAAQPNADCFSSPLKIKSVTRPVIDPQLADTLPHRLHVSRMTESQTVQPGRDQRSRGPLPHAPSRTV